MTSYDIGLAGGCRSSFAFPCRPTAKIEEKLKKVYYGIGPRR